MRLLKTLFLGLLPSLALAQIGGGGISGGFIPNNIVSPTNGQCLTYSSAVKAWVNAACAGGGSGTVTSVGASSTGSIAITGSPITTAGTMTFDLGALTGDCTTTAGTLATTCTKTGGVAFGTFATANAVSPPAIGGTTAAAGTFTTLTNTTGVANLASNLTQAANTSVDGLTLIDSTAATVGNQQFSPRIRLTGQGWKTTATAASQTVDWIIENEPIQGTTNPGSTLYFKAQINGGGYTTPFLLQQNGNITVGGGAGFAGSIFAPNYLNSGGQSGLQFSALTALIVSNSVTAIAATSTSVTVNTNLISAGTKFVATGCSNTTTVGGQVAGSYNSGTTGICTVVLTLPTTTNGYSCQASDTTTAADVQTMTASTTTSATISGTTVTGDVIKFFCMGY